MDLSFDEIYNKYRICSKHFLPEHIQEPRRKRGLTYNAVPSLLLPRMVQGKIPFFSNFNLIALLLYIRFHKELNSNCVRFESVLNSWKLLNPCFLFYVLKSLMQSQLQFWFKVKVRNYIITTCFHEDSGRLKINLNTKNRCFFGFFMFLMRVQIELKLN